MEHVVKLYKVDKYNKTEKFIKKSYEEFSLDEAIEKLKFENSYHMRLEKNKQYIFFGDCDGFDGDFKKFSVLLKEFLNKFYDIKIKKKDVSYTENKSKLGSFHYSISSLYGYSDKILKQIHEKFAIQYEELCSIDEKGKKKNCIDTSIYTDKWFRMPNQKKEGRIGTEHIIVKGNLKDFILNYIPKNSISIDNKIYVQHAKQEKILITDEYLNSDDEQIISDKTKKIINKNKENINNSIIIKNDNNTKNDIVGDEIKKYIFVDFVDAKESLNNLKKERADIYLDWNNVGMALHHVSSDEKFLKLWIEWSKQSEDKFEEGVCEKKWKTFKKKEKGFTFASILHMLKIDNYEKFIFIIKRLNIKNIIMERKKHFPNNELEIDNIISNNNLYHIQLADKHCPILKEEHNKRSNYLEINKYGQLVMKCHCQTCRGIEFPQEEIQLSKNEMKNIFNFTQNNYITINNNFNDDPNEIYSEIIKLDSNSKIFEDNELNKLMLESLTGSDAKIAKVIFYLVKNKIACSKEKIWFEFKNHRWTDSEYITMYVSDELVNYYQKIILFVNKSNELTEMEKNIGIKEIKKIIKILETKIRKTNIIDEVGSRMRITNPKFFEKLDTVPYIIGFNNGVYDLKKWNSETERLKI